MRQKKKRDEKKGDRGREKRGNKKKGLPTLTRTESQIKWKKDTHQRLLFQGPKFWSLTSAS